MPFGPLELLILLFIILLIFGAKKVPEMGRSLGSSMREFKDGITSFGEDEPERKESERKELERGAAESPRSEPTAARSERTT
jgi:sec-independent protein translocase protein TatA